MGRIPFEKPAAARWAGWAALVEELNLDVPLGQASAVSEDHRHRKAAPYAGEPAVTLYDARSGSAPGPFGALKFALKNEKLDLLILRKAIKALPEAQIAAFIRTQPTSEISRRLWAFTEFFLGRRIDVPPVKAPSVDLIDRSAFHTLKGARIPHNGVVDNLPGVAGFCPLVARFPVALDLEQSKARAQAVMAATTPDLTRRALNHLRIADTRASFEIEGEKPSIGRVHTFERAQAAARREPLSVKLLDDLQRQVFDPSARFTPPPGLRSSANGREVFLGHHDRRDGSPAPEHIGARAADAPELVNALIDFWRKTIADDGFDPFVRAAALSFGFVNIHPYADGNGRLHRFLLDYALEAGGVADGMTLPVSQAILDDLDGYGRALTAMSGPMMPHIAWEAGRSGNVRILSDTADLYRHPRIDPCVAFTGAIVKDCLDRTIPAEIDWLRRHDLAAHEATAALRDLGVDLPSKDLSLAIAAALQNHGKIGRKKREKLFEGVPADALDAVEGVVAEAFGLQGLVPDGASDENAPAR